MWDPAVERFAPGAKQQTPRASIRRVSDPQLHHMPAALSYARGTFTPMTETQEGLQAAGFVDVELVRRNEGMRSVVRGRLR